ncbi:hypothetical protein GKE82_18505 [Conexibacter sp. W3-3-2]|uniref:hypothetical protein n=1 Tax=Conexibacter sp. W3-3-2 TaxID=2675227 RepID=UPI0012B8CF3B|nr:hypothetical protein [Conexibacter sp. W3-3-2]MTD46224.1 hypothetical protein [Conexibacter sp. W3-3-2]
MAATLTAAGILAAPSATHAATYTIQQCHSQTNYAVSGLVGSFQGAYAYTNQACDPSSRTVGAALTASGERSGGEFAQVTFSAPQGTSLDSISARRTATAGAARANGAPVARLSSIPSGSREAFAAVAGYPASGQGMIAFALDGDRSVSWGAYCEGTSGCPVGDTSYSLQDIEIRLRDNQAPSLANVAGTLRSETDRARVRSLTYDATDAGGGVFRERLIIDGSERSTELADANGGRCVLPFTTPTPCKPDMSGSVSFDTSTLSDGTHQLVLDVRDATDENKRLHGPWTITVDNVPPAVGAPAVSGTAREGDVLTCTAPVAGQTPEVRFQWIRAASDGSARYEIPGATNAAYTISAADEGRKLICRVSATDNGGTADRESSITQPPFADGQLVSTYCTNRPTGSTDECGDLDGDRIANRNDDDLDGDGVPNLADSAPYDSSRPGSPASPSSSTTTTNTSSTANSSTTLVGGTTVGAAGTVRFLLGRETAVYVGKQARWVRSSFKMRGRLTRPDGSPMGGLKLFVTQAVNGKTVALGSTVTDPDGNWAFQIPRGPSRTLVVAAGDGVNAATLTVRQRVTAHVTLRAIRKKIRSGGLAQFRGQLRGGHTNSREKLVEFQVYFRRSWRTIGTFRVGRDGRFSVKYRFGTAAYGRYSFRARTMPTDGYPFAVGTSRGRTATVRVG